MPNASAAAESKSASTPSQSRKSCPCSAPALRVIASGELQNDWRVVRGLLPCARSLIDLTALEPRLQIWREQEVVDADAAVALERLAEIVPVRELPTDAGIQRPERVGISHAQHCAVSVARFGLEEGVALPVLRLVAVDVLRNHVEVSADYGWRTGLQPCCHLPHKPLHPVQLVMEVFAADWVAIRRVDVHDAEIADHGLEVTRMAVGVIAHQCRADHVDGAARQNRHSGVCLLRNRCRPVPELFKEQGRELSPF